ncbi:Urb2/Npa2 family protein [Nitzschia inconspicua]|uniref:Urb2/Npa2 family protein n=1 Tax=Nitzschia inconspicua TaxID=303405 RepID=A0A9K3LLT5_9STRA|nr:Urb2/Npa2 family protein [Nitzschia inconspicua]
MTSKRKRPGDTNVSSQLSRQKKRQPPEEENFETTQPSCNPFLKLYGKLPSQTDDTDHSSSQSTHESTITIFDRMLEFSNLSNQSFKKICSVENKMEAALLEESVEDLLIYLDIDESSKEVIKRQNQVNQERDACRLVVGSSLVSRADALNLLLPWSVKGILQAETYRTNSFSDDSVLLQPSVTKIGHLFWKTLHATLTWKIRSSTNEDNSSLTLSTMHKIAPIALDTAINNDRGADTNPDNVSLARESFCLLIDNLYQPSFDAVCDSLLPAIAKAKLQTVAKTKNWLRVTKSILSLLLTRLGNANPKKSFQVLLRTDTFLHLALVFHHLQSCREIELNCKTESNLWDTVQTTYRSFIMEGFFSLSHHIDGFRSLQLVIPKTMFEPINANEKGNLDTEDEKTTKVFRCYQEDLLSLLRASIVQRNVNGLEGAVNEDSVIAIVDFATVLVEAFLSQTSELQVQQQNQHQNITKKNKNVSKIVHLQFRFVANVIGYLLEALLQHPAQNESLHVALYGAVAMILRLLLDFNVYRPSAKNIEEKDFLNAIAKGTVAAMMAERSVAETNVSNPNIVLPTLPTESPCTFKILTILFQLDHTTLQDQLHSIFAWCVTSEPTSQDRYGITTVCTDFLVVSIGAFKKLRQVDLFYKNYHEGLRVLLKTENQDRLHHLNVLSRCDVISSSLGDAVHTSPIQQIKRIFSDANETISDMVDSRNSVTSKCSALSTAIRLLVLLVRNVRIDVTTHSELSPSILNIMRNTIPKLLDCKVVMKQSELSFFDETIALCSCTLNAKQRCEFWVTKETSRSVDKDEIHAAILQALDDAVATQAVQKSTNNIATRLQNELKLLACQRIRQLHKQMFEKEQISFTNVAKDGLSNAELSEARKLVHFVLQNGGSKVEHKDLDSRLSSWEVLSETLQTWTPHAGAEEVDTFLDLFLRILSSEAIPDERRLSNVGVFLKDASFLEIASVSKRLGVRVVSIIVTAFTEVLKCDQNEHSRLLAIVGAKSNEGKIIRHDLSPFVPRSEDLEFIELSIQRCNMLLVTINGVQSCVWESCDDPLNTLETLITIDNVIVVGLLPSIRLETSVLTSIACNLRSASSRLLLALYDQHDSLAFGPRHRILLQHVLNSVQITISALDFLKAEKDKMDLILSSSHLLSSAVRFSANADFDFPKDAVSLLDGSVCRKLDTSDENWEAFTISCATGLLRVVRNSDVLNGEDVLRAIEIRHWKKAQNCVMRLMETDSINWNLSMDFLAEGLRVSANGKKRYRGSKLLLDDQFVSQIVGSMRDTMSSNTAKRLAYLLSCLAHSQLSKRTRDEVINQLFHHHFKGRKEFKTPLCAFVSLMEPDQLSELVTNLCKGPNSCQLSVDAARIELFHSLLLSSEDPDRLKVLSSHTEFFLGACLQLLSSEATNHDRDAKIISLATSLIIEIASRREIATIREKDVATIISSMASTVERFLTVTTKDKDEIMRGVNAFEACYSLLSFFMQRFSKQTQSCLSCLTRCLMTMLEFTLYVPMPEASLLECGQRFSRLCELLLPHGEVYKKHVLSLIVQFVKGLADDVDAIRKKSLLNGIYCLLDIIQDHETRQLNSMLDEMGRALLLSVHQGYKKHAYKGQ